MSHKKKSKVNVLVAGFSESEWLFLIHSWKNFSYQLYESQGMLCAGLPAMLLAATSLFFFLLWPPCSRIPYPMFWSWCWIFFIFCMLWCFDILEMNWLGKDCRSQGKPVLRDSRWAPLIAPVTCQPLHPEPSPQSPPSLGSQASGHYRLPWSPQGQVPDSEGQPLCPGAHWKYSS